jgi:hypothetical protein
MYLPDVVVFVVVVGQTAYYNVALFPSHILDLLLQFRDQDDLLS